MFDKVLPLYLLCRAVNPQIIHNFENVCDLVLGTHTHIYIYIYIMLLYIIMYCTHALAANLSLKKISGF